MKVGKNVIISPKVSIYNGDKIEIGDNVRIDDFCVLSGGEGLKIGSHVHIAVNCSLFAGGGIRIGDFCNIAAYSLLLSESDDYGGRSLVGPIIPRKYKPTYKVEEIILDTHVSLGVRTTLMPGVKMGKGSVTGGYTYVLKNCEPWGVYVGIPARKLKERERDVLSLAEQFLKEYKEREIDETVFR